MVSLLLGDLSALDPMVFGTDTFLEVEVAGEILSRVPLVSVPYAFRADSARLADDALRVGSLSAGDLSNNAANLAPFVICANKVGHVYIPGHSLADADGCVAEANLAVESSGWTEDVPGDKVHTTTPTRNVGIGTSAPGSKLTVAGTIESTSGGIKFPDGTTQATA